MCEFCESRKFKPVDAYEADRQRTAHANILTFLGKCGSKDETNGFFIDEEDGVYYLVLDNSSGEYAKGVVKISFCPMCGRKLENDANRN